MDAERARDEAVVAVGEATRQVKNARVFARMHPSAQAAQLLQALEALRDEAVDSLLLAHSVLHAPPVERRGPRLLPYVVEVDA